MARTFRYFEKKRGHRRTGSRFIASVGEAIFFAVMLALGIVGIIASVARLIAPEWRANHDFAKTTARIVERRIAEVQGEKGVLYRPEIKIDYEILGTGYSCATFDIHYFGKQPTLFATREAAQAAIDRFADQSTCDCWFDPADPATAVVVRGYQWWIWPALVIPASFVAIGIAGLIYTAIYWGKSLERRAAAVRKLPASELFDLPARGDPKYPFVPSGSEITSSPGTCLAYRLPLVQSPGWTLFGLLAASIIWNGPVLVFLVMAARSIVRGAPDWLMILFVAPFLGVGAALVAVFARQLRHTAGIGPTLVEISDHPLAPGRTYRVFFSQSGNLTLKSLSIWVICEEEAVFRQGTNARTESREVFRQAVFTVADAVIRPSEALEGECDLMIPAEAMHSFRANHNQVQWKLLVQSELVGWQSFQRSFPIVVRSTVATAQLVGVVQ